MADECVNHQFCKQCQEKYDAINDGQNKRLDALEESVKQIQSLTIAVEKMSVNIEQMTKELVRQGERLNEIESEPGKKWKEVTKLAITVIVTAVLTYFLTSIGVK